MNEDYSEMPEDELLELVQAGDTAAHYEQGRRHGLASKKEKGSATSRMKAVKNRYGFGGFLLWGIVQLLFIAFGPACVAGLLYTAYYAGKTVYFGYHDYTIFQRVEWYVGTFFFISLLLRVATVATQFLLERRPLSTLLIIAAVCWYFYEYSPLDRFWP